MLSEIDIIITTRNRINDLLFTIDHMKELGFEEPQFYVIDDASTDQTSQILQKKHSDIRLFTNTEPNGQIINRNFLYQVTHRPYILSLDDDSHVILKEDIEEAIHLLRSNTRYGIFNFKVFAQLQSPPAKDLLEKQVYLTRTFIACGCILKRELISKIGYYCQKELLFYGEELDCAIRGYLNGYYVVNQANLVVHHRIDWVQRDRQKKSVVNKGIYGTEWRTKVFVYSNLMIIGLYYPWGLNIVFSAVFIAKSAYQQAITGNLNGFVSGVGKFLRSIPFVIRNRYGMSYTLFKSWFNLP